MKEPDDFDIARNIRDIEALKTGLLSGVAGVFELMADTGAGREALGEALAGVVFNAMELAGRVGVPVDDLDRLVTRRIRNKRIANDAV